MTLARAVSAQPEVGAERVPAMATAAGLDHECRLERVERGPQSHELTQPDPNEVVLSRESVHTLIVPRAQPERKCLFRPALPA